MTDDDGAGLFGLEPTADPAPEPGPRGSRRWALVVVAVVAAGTVGLGVYAAGATSPPSAATSAVVAVESSSTPAPTPSAVVPSPTPPPTPTETPTPTLPPAQLAAQQAELRQTAALLPRLRLSSPASWDRWLPAGKPYPGADTADDISTCPAISSRLTAALGMKMSYWIGTLPMGPNGCDYATVPLDYNGPYHYPYTFEIGYLSGPAAQQQQFLEDHGAACPQLEVPAVAPGAVLVRCENDMPGYTLVLHDSRRADGVWFLEADARPTARHPASYALVALLHALEQVYR